MTLRLRANSSFITLQLAFSSCGRILESVRSRTGSANPITLSQ